MKDKLLDIWLLPNENINYLSQIFIFITDKIF